MTIYLLKAIKAYDSYEYKKCLDYINDYEKALLKVCYRNNQRLSISNQEEAVILSYQAYSLKNLKKYLSVNLNIVRKKKRFSKKIKKKYRKSKQKTK